MAVLPEEIPTGTLKGQFYFVNEDNIDADTKPELTVVKGFVRCVASVKTLRMASKKAIVIPLRFDAEFDGQGNLKPVNGNGVGMELPAVDSPLFDTTGWTWSATFELVEVETGFTVNLAPVTFQIFEGKETDLSEIIPVEASPGIVTTRGLKGDKGDPGLDGSNVLPTNEAVAQAIETEGPTKTALSAAIDESVQPGGSARPTIDDAIIFEGAKRFIEAATLKGPGIDPTGATSSTAAIQAKINAAGGMPVYVPAGNYICPGLTAPTGSTIIAFGGATFKTGAAGGTILNLTNSSRVRVKGLVFQGTLAAFTAEGLTGPGATAEIGIRLNKGHGTIIDDCMFLDLNYGGIHVASTGNLSMGGRFDGDANRIIGCHAENCFYGLDLDIRAEYITVTASVFQRCNTGARNKGGNNLFTGCHFSRNTLGFYLAIGTNSGHGSAVGCTFNHNGAIAVQVDEQANGFIFSGCQFFSPKIVFNQCSGVIITGSQIGSNIQIKGGGWNTIKDSVALGTPVVTHNYEGVTDATIVSITKLDGTVLS